MLGGSYHARCADDDIVTESQRLGRRLIPARRTYWDGAQLVRATKVRLKCRQYWMECGQIDIVTRPLELDAFEAVACFIHLEKHHHRHATDHLVGQEDVDLTVAEVEGSAQPRRIRAELP